jgi:predicted ATPase/DNA-binding SARP family transcriptional activator/tetratricopeptide (TPR) repeat protein
VHSSVVKIRGKAWSDQEFCKIAIDCCGKGGLIPVSAPDPIASPLTIRCLGPLDVHVDGQPLPPLRTRKGQWLLALLILKHGREVQRDWLAGTLWPESQEERALYNLRRTLTDLRQALGRQAQRLRSSTAHTLCLDLAGAQVDLLAFDAAVAHADPLSLEAAVALYGGELLEGCTEEWVLHPRETREQAYLQALERLAEQVMQAGDTARAAGYLRAVIARDPLREGAQRRLLQALAAGGDYAAAVQVYRELRLHLRRDLNAEPDAETSVLFAQLRQQARAQARTSRRPASTSDTTALPPPQELSAPHARVTPPHNLPVQVSSFIGRRKEVETLKQLLLRSRLLTLTGVGGGGKTRLALAVAAEVLEAYPEGVWLVELAALSDPALVPQTAARALGLREEPGRSLQQTLVEYLRPRKLLLVLDNCEHLIAACAPLVNALLSGCPDLKVLVTSREALHVGGEQPWQVPPMAHPATVQLRAEEKEVAAILLEYDACRLFVERARVQQPEFALNRDNVLVLAQLCERLDGIPLALELAASRLRALTLEEIHQRLTDRFHLLRGGSRTSLPRHQTLRALIDWSYERLEAEEQLLLQRLSVFVGGWNLEAAEAVCAEEREKKNSDSPSPAERSEGIQGVAGRGSDRSEPSPCSGAGGEGPLPPGPGPLADAIHPSLFPDEVLDLLTSLVDKSLVVFETMGKAGGRYGLLETIRQYGQERLAETEEGPQMRGRHRDYFLALAEAAASQLGGPEQGMWLERLEAEHANLRAALAWSLEEGSRGEGRGKREERREGRGPIGNRKSEIAEVGLQLAGALTDFWLVRGHLSEGRAWCDAALAAEGAAGRTKVRAKALRGAGDLATIQSDHGAARTLYEESLAIYRELGDKREIGFSLYSLGNFEESLSLFREIGDRHGIAYLLKRLGDLAREQGDYGAARTLYEEGLSLFREIRDRRGIAHSLGGLGNVAHDQGDYGAARALYEESLAICRELGDKQGIAYLLLGLGDMAHDQGDYGAARALYEESLAICRELGDKQGIAYLLTAFADLAATQDQPERAVRLWAAAEALRRTIGSTLLPDKRQEYDRNLTAAQEALGEETFAAAWEQGRAMALEQAIEYTLHDGQAIDHPY